MCAACETPVRCPKTWHEHGLNLDLNSLAGLAPEPVQGVVSGRLLKKTDKVVHEFESCANLNADSIYFWALQPIFAADNRAVGAQVLVRTKNGGDAAPFHDLQKLADPAADEATKQVYARWKGTEVVDWLLGMLKTYKSLQQLHFICVTLHPLDLSPESLVFKDVTKRLFNLSEHDRKLLLSMVCVHVHVDSKTPHDLCDYWLKVWRLIGFRCACKAMDDAGRRHQSSEVGAHGHITLAWAQLLTPFWLFKVDRSWAALILSPSGHIDGKRLEEFASWALAVINRGLFILFEFTLRRNDEHSAKALDALKKLGVDILGAHAAHFCFQGGFTEAKAFRPQQLADNVMMSSTVAYKIALCDYLCFHYNTNPEKLLSEGCAMETQLNNISQERKLGEVSMCQVKAAGPYKEAGATKWLNREYEAVIIVNKDSLLEKSHVAKAVKEIVKRKFEKRKKGAGGTILGNPRVTPVEMADDKTEQDGTEHGWHDYKTDDGYD